MWITARIRRSEETSNCEPHSIATNVRIFCYFTHSRRDVCFAREAFQVARKQTNPNTEPEFIKQASRLLLASLVDEDARFAIVFVFCCRVQGAISKDRLTVHLQTIDCYSRTVKHASAAKHKLYLHLHIKRFIRFIIMLNSYTGVRATWRNFFCFSPLRKKVEVMCICVLHRFIWQ